MPIYSIRVHLPHPDYPLMTAYDIEAPNRDDAQKLAREKFAGIYGCEEKKLKTYVLYNAVRQAEDLQYYRDHGLPDEIPS